MSRLPTPGSDDGNWGTILNDFLSVTHDADGTIKSGAISESQLDASVQTKLNGAIPFHQTYATKPADPIEQIDINYTLASSNPDILRVYVNSFQASWHNEWGALRGTSPYTSYGDALVRAIRQNSDQIGTGQTALASNAVELVDRRTGANENVMWGRSWVDGHLTRNGNTMADCIVLGAADTVPANLPAGTIIIRTS